MAPEPGYDDDRGWPVAAGLVALGGLAASYFLIKRAVQAAGRESFHGQTVVITGGSRGLGFALAQRFAAEGARLALIARSSDQLDDAARRLRSTDAQSVMTIPCDVRDPEAVRRAVARVASDTGRIDVLVNNAGVIQVTPFDHAQPSDFQDSLDTHFWGPLHLINACLPFFRSQRSGRIVNIASIGGRIAVPHLLPYVVGKFALVGLSEGLHAELKSSGISVTTVTPHLMQTGSHRNAMVRGQHAREATWFALGTATRLTAMDAHRAAAQIVEAARARRAVVTPGWQARLAEIAHATSPELVASLSAAVARFALPGPTDDARGDAAVRSSQVDVGGISRVFASNAAVDLNQRLAPDEAARRPEPAH